MPAIKAIIFDFDGVLFDTEPLHFSMFQEVLGSEGITLTAERYEAAYVGLTDAACFRAILNDKKVAVSDAVVDRLVRRKTDLMQRALRANLPQLPGMMEFVRDAYRSQRLAIASGALIQEVMLCLEIADMIPLFEHITEAGDVPQGKPDPGPYLHALDALNRRSPLRADECVVIEDTPRGIEAAHKAGMRCIGVTTTLPASRLSQADLVISSLQSVRADALLRQLPR
jgi:HAD superfamily hydrolase (TIGR01509 family)